MHDTLTLLYEILGPDALLPGLHEAQEHYDPLHASTPSGAVDGACCTPEALQQADNAPECCYT